MADSTPSLRDVLTVAGGISVIIGAFMLGRSTHPEEGCCDKLMERNVEILVARSGGYASPVLRAAAYRPLPSPVDPWPTHPWDGAGAPPGVRGVES